MNKCFTSSYTKTRFHQDVRVGFAIDGGSDSAPLGGGRQQQAAWRRQSRVWSWKDLLPEKRNCLKSQILCQSATDISIVSYLFLLVMSGRLWLTRPWLSSRMDWGLMLRFTKRPATILLNTACTRFDTFKLTVFSSIWKTKRKSL